MRGAGPRRSAGTPATREPMSRGRTLYDLSGTSSPRKPSGSNKVHLINADRMVTLLQKIGATVHEQSDRIAKLEDSANRHDSSFGDARTTAAKLEAIAATLQKLEQRQEDAALSSAQAIRRLRTEFSQLSVTGGSGQGVPFSEDDGNSLAAILDLGEGATDAEETPLLPKPSAPDTAAVFAFCKLVQEDVIEASAELQRQRQTVVRLERRVEAALSAAVSDPMQQMGEAPLQFHSLERRLATLEREFAGFRRRAADEERGHHMAGLQLRQPLAGVPHDLPSPPRDATVDGVSIVGLLSENDSLRQELAVARQKWLQHSQEETSRRHSAGRLRRGPRQSSHGPAPGRDSSVDTSGVLSPVGKPSGRHHDPRLP
eukprot:Hpha_TRINITY_DN30513_c0_g1::TRINITY_DN30513_c0_g1_i1::g.193759::m.193759